MQVIDYRQLIGTNPEKMFKSTIFESPHMLLGLNCLEPGQADRVHVHHGQDKFYFVLEGEAEFTVGGESRIVGSGNAVIATDGVEHGVKNLSAERAVILMALAPWQS